MAGTMEYPIIPRCLMVRIWSAMRKASACCRTVYRKPHVLLLINNAIPELKKKVISAIPSIEIRNGELMGCTTVVLKEPLADEEMEDLQDYLHGQFSDGWGEGFEQQEIQTDDGVLYVHFGEAEPFYFEVEQMQPAEPLKEQLPPHRPKMKLVGQDGNIFSILGRASRLLKENGQPDQAKEMCDRVYQSGNYYKALNIISEYVETELSEKTHTKSKNEKERGDAR